MSQTNDARKILVLGAHGMLGKEMIRALKKTELSGQVDARDRSSIDLSRPESVCDAVVKADPAWIVNCAAMTDVDGCESRADEAMQVNAGGPALLAEAAARASATLVHFSTDFVFGGGGGVPCREEDEVNPLSVYGRSKWEGEKAIRESGCRHLIIRTSWLFGDGRNFVEAILDRAARGEPLRVVDDQVGRPTLTADLADGTMRLIRAGATGTVHFANTGQCSWYEFASEIVRRAGYDVDITPIGSDGLNRPARRPAWSVLDLSAYEKLTGHKPADWVDALDRYLRSRADDHCDSTLATGK